MRIGMNDAVGIVRVAKRSGKQPDLKEHTKAR